MVRQSEKSLVDRIRVFQRAEQANKRCADCVERGPTYICLDFQTFVCQTCSGLHREFGHKIKGISLSEWAVAEVEAIEAGGNQRAAQKWLGRWNKEEFPEPDSSDLDNLRQFLQKKYVEKRWLSKQRPDGAAPQASVQKSTADAAGVAAQAEAQPQPCAAPTKPANVTDLLSDAGSSPTSLAPPVPVPATVSAPIVGVAPPAPLLGGCGAAQWTADFGNMETKLVVGPSACEEGLIDLDFCTVDASPCPTAPQITETIALCGATLPKGEAPSKPQDTDSTPAVKSPVAEPAEEPAPTRPVPAAPAAAAAGAGSEAANLGERLREAVLHGSTDDLMRLYKQCAERSEPPKRQAMPQDRIAAFAAFDELGAADTPADSARPLAPPSAAVTGGGNACVASHGLPTGSSLPTPMPAGARIAGAGPSTATQRPPDTGAMTPQLLTQLMPQKYGMMTPQQLEKLSPQELVQMQLMIQSALQVRAQGPASAPPRTAAASGALQRAPSAGALAAAERPPSPPKPFGDLITAFTEKNPMAGFRVQA